MSDATLKWNPYRVGGGYWTVERVNPALRDGAPLYARPPAAPPPPSFVYRTMVLSVPEGGEITLTFPEPLTQESVEMADEGIRLLFRRLRRVAQSQIADGDAEYASWQPSAPAIGEQQ